MALRKHIDLSVGRPPSRDVPGRPHARWIEQVRRDLDISPVKLMAACQLSCDAVVVLERHNSLAG